MHLKYKFCESSLETLGACGAQDVLPEINGQRPVLFSGEKHEKTDGQMTGGKFNLFPNVNLRTCRPANLTIF